MDVALDEARRRPDIPTAATDQDNCANGRADFRVLGGRHVHPNQDGAAATCASFRFDGIEPSLESFEAGSYPFEKPL